MCAGITEKLKA